MSEVRNGEQPAYALSTPYKERREVVNLPAKPAPQVPYDDELLGGERDDARTSDDDLVSDLSRTVGQTIRSAQEVAHSLIGRARRREAVIRAKTDERCSLMVAQAEREATAILQRAAGEAVQKVQEAENGIADMLAAANHRRDRVLAELQRQSGVLQDKVARLRQEHDRLAQALDVLDEALRHGKEALFELDGDVDFAALGGPSAPVAQHRETGAPSPTVRSYAGGGVAPRRRAL